MNDDQLRSLLTDAVSDVEPTRDLDLSAESPRPRPRWLPVTVAAALATVLVVTGTAWLVQRDGDAPAATGSAAQVSDVVTAFAIVTTPEGRRLEPEQREVAPTSDTIAAAVRETMVGAPSSSASTGFLVDQDDLRIEVSSTRDGVSVDVAPGEGSDGYWVAGAGSDIALLPQAIAWTVAAATTSDAPVRITLAGEAEGDFFGTDIAEPLVPDLSVLTTSAAEEQEALLAAARAAGRERERTDELRQLAEQQDAAEGGPWVDAYAVTQATGTPLVTADRRQVPEGTDPLQGAVEATVAGQPDTSGLFGLWPVGTPVTARERSGVIEVDFPEGLSGDVPSESALGTVALQTIVWAATAAVDDPDAGVRFLVRGEPVSSLLELDTSQPMTRQVDASVVAPVTIDSVGNGETVSSPFTVSGLATALEGTVTWKLVRQEQTVRSGFATAGQGGTPSPYSFRVQAPPGSYTLEVRETDPSDGEGRAPFGVVRQVTVR